jgi:antitoxin HigA-1
VPSNRITAILKDQRGVTGDTAIRLGTFFKTSAEFWMNLQMIYDLRTAEKGNRHMKQGIFLRDEPGPR